MFTSGFHLHINALASKHANPQIYTYIHIHTDMYRNLYKHTNTRAHTHIAVIGIAL